MLAGREEGGGGGRGRGEEGLGRLRNMHQRPLKTVTNGVRGVIGCAYAPPVWLMNASWAERASNRGYFFRGPTFSLSRVHTQPQDVLIGRPRHEAIMHQPPQRARISIAARRLTQRNARAPLFRVSLPLPCLPSPPLFPLQIHNNTLLLNRAGWPARVVWEVPR